MLTRVVLFVYMEQAGTERQNEIAILQKKWERPLLGDPQNDQLGERMVRLGEKGWLG